VIHGGSTKANRVGNVLQASTREPSRLEQACGFIQ
jgi:hypothetical protein